MLGQWLNCTEVLSFARDYLRKAPFASPSTARDAMALFNWNTLEQLLIEHPSADILVVARGKLLDLPRPRGLAETRALMVQGIGLVIRRAEEHDPALAALAASFTQYLPGKANVQLFVTPAGTHGFGWHYDDEDVFIVQTEGAKDYYFRANSVESNRPPQTAPDFTRFSSETSPIGTARLLPGDWLYLPSRWWHVAKCNEDSLSISLGVYLDPSWVAAIRRHRENSDGRDLPMFGTEEQS
jgi:50S ribosomal protein L16 3-hydroxylase